jgi:hypothetical protein
MMRRLLVSAGLLAGWLALAAAEPAGKMQPVDVSKGRATLRGKITLKGDDPAAVLAKLTKSLQAQMDDHTDKKCCREGKAEEVTTQAWRVGDNKQLGNVFVWVQPPKDYYFPVSPAEVRAAAAAPVEIGQPHCAFVPHVAVLFPCYADPTNPANQLPTKQTFTVKNDAPVNHNVFWGGTAVNPGDNKTLGPGAKLAIDLEPDRLPVSVRCTIHPWMGAKVGVFNHPYATVSRSDTAPAGLRVKKDDKEFGTYEITNVPAGVPLRLFAWHEEIGFLHKGAFKGEEVELKAGPNGKDFVAEVKEGP